MSGDQFQQLMQAMVQARIEEGSLSDCTHTFDGTRDFHIVEDFISNVSTYISSKHVSEVNAILGLGPLLKNDARRWWDGVKSGMRSWNEVTTTIRRVFQPPQPNWLLINDISQDKQGDTESTDAYVTRQISRISRLTNFPMQDAQQLDMIYGRLRLKIKKAVPRDTVTNVNGLLDRARTVEQHEREAKETGIITPEKKTCVFCKNHGHLESECRKKQAALKRKEPFAKERPAQPTRTDKVLPSSSSNSNKTNFSCYGCGAPNVYRSKCTTCTKVAKPLPQHKEFYSIHQEIGTDLPTIASQISGYNTLAYLDTCARASIASRELYFHLLDTAHPFDDILTTITLADGSKTTKMVKRTVASIRIGDRVHQIQMMVIPDAVNNKTLLGADFIKSVGIIPNLIQDAWCYSDDLSKWYLFDYLQGDPNELTHLTSPQMTKSSMLPPMSSTVKISKNKRRKRTTQSNIRKEYVTSLATEQDNPKELEQFQPIRMNTPPNTPSRSTTPLHETTEANEPSDQMQSVDSILEEIEFLGQVFNAQDILKRFTSPSYLPKMLSPIGSTPKAKKGISEPEHEILYFEPAQVKKPDKADKPNTIETAELQIFLVDFTLRDNEGTKLSDVQRNTVNKMINNHKDVFNEVGPATKETEHRIETLNHLPVASAPYRLPAAKREALKKEIQVMIDTDVIEESESPWASNVVMKLKPNGKWRICIDYRRLNEVTIADKYPLPLIDDLLQDARGTLFMSTIDLHSGFWQIKIREDDKEKTAFVTPFGMYQFKRMPFGLKNASASFQRLINKFKNSLPEMKILTYLDDIILVSTTFDKHLEELDQVFQQLRKFKLRANREKCHFACAEVKYLGHIITMQGIRADPAKIEAIRCRRPPQDVKQLLSFIQTCSWYRRFIEDFAKIIQPLTNLTKKNVKWEWSQLEQKSFDKLKLSLCMAPILQQVDPDKPFIIKTDASAYAIGAVLVQGELEDEHPIEYASRLLTTAEQNYSTIEREALAVVWSTEKFRGYIDGGVTIISDHQPLKWLMSLKSPSGRLARWALKLQQYDLKIQYQPGKINVVADCLSRPPCPSTETENHQAEQCMICMVQIDIPARGAAAIREQQIKDDELAKIINAFEDEAKQEELVRYTTRGYFTNNGVLYRYNQSSDEDSEDALLVIPKQEIQRILTEYHDAPTAGHYGVQRTMARIASRYTWTGMRKQIAAYVDKCKECQKYKAHNLKPAGLIQSTAAYQRFETIAMDLFGPLPTSTDGYRHILIVEDVATKWVELFKLKEATAENCADIMLNEIFLRFGTPRRLISDNGSQFVSAVMQKLTFCMDIEHILLPVYHPQANPVERRNRDLKHQLAIQVGTNHDNWPVQLAAIRFAMNTAKSDSTGYTAAYLTFGRNLRAQEDIRNDLRAIVRNENFIPEITPKLLQLTETVKRVQESIEIMQNRNQQQSDKNRRTDPGYNPGDKVLIKTHLQSKKDQLFTAKLAPKRDGPYVILQKTGAATYEIASLEDEGKSIGTYHTVDITPFKEKDDDQAQPVYPIRRRGRPKKQ